MVLLSFFYVSLVILGPLSAILYHTFQYKCHFLKIITYILLHLIFIQ